MRHFYDFWPELAAQCERMNYAGLFATYKITGEWISGPVAVAFGTYTFTLADGTEKTIPFQRHNRPKFVELLLLQAKKIGIEITFGTHVVDYFEDAETQKAGVVLEDGTKLEADMVVAADGVGTKSNRLVTGHEIRAYPSGISIFRTAFPMELAMADPEVQKRWPLLESGKPYIEMWSRWVLLSPWDGTALICFDSKENSIGIQRYGDIMSWWLMHKVCMARRFPAIC